MNELIKALTELVRVATAYLEERIKEAPKQDQVPANMIRPEDRPPHREPVQEGKPPRKARKLTEPVAEAGVVKQEVSLEELNAIAAQYMQRFNGAVLNDESGKPQGFWDIVNLLKKEYKVEKLKELSPGHRVRLAEHLKATMKAADRTPVTTGIEI